MTVVDWITPDAVAPPPVTGWRDGIAYYRISNDPEHDELGVRRQRREVHDYAAAHQVRIVAEYVDDDRSAFVAKHRPDYEQMLDHAGSPSVHVVLAWHPDR